MKTYELLTVFKPNLDAEEIDKNLSKIEDAVKNYGGKTLNTDKIGRKKLAYDIDKFRDGFFVSRTLNIPADKVVDFKKQLKLNDSIIRTMFMETSKIYATK